MVGQSASVLRTLLVLGAVLAAVIVRYRPPAVRAATAPASVFSAARAEPVLRAIAGDAVPHPTGSVANARVRAAVVAELERLGTHPVVESDFVCGTSTCATVHNIVARIPGVAPRQEIILAAHHDSVAAGPGAGDDGAGVAAAVEVTRALLASPPLRDDVTILIDDAEEQGLLGAVAFVRRHAAARLPRVVVNVEARGTSGASLMFETSSGNSPLVAAASEALQRPVTNSIYYTIYQHLPNDTDLTVFRWNRYRGVNFAFVGDAARYHTPRDSPEFLDRRSLQHHGDNALAMIRTLAGASPAGDPARDDVFFDVMTLGVIRWPAFASSVFALAALVLLVVVVSHRIRPFRHVVFGAALPVAAAAAAYFGGRGILHLLLLAGFPRVTWIAHPLLPKILFWSLAAGVPPLFALLFRRFCNREGEAERAHLFADTGRDVLGGSSAVHAPGGVTPQCWDGVAAGAWIAVAIIAVIFAGGAPGLSYPFIVGAAVAAVTSLFPSTDSHLHRLLPLAAFSAMTFPIAWLLYDGMGLPKMPLVAAVVALTIAPMTADFLNDGRRAALAVTGLAGGGVLVAFALMLVVPPYSRSTPRALSIVHYSNAGDSARWLADASGGDLPPVLVRAGRFASRAARGFAWDDRSLSWHAPAAASVPAPMLVAKRDAGGAVVTVNVRSRRGAAIVGVVVPRDVVLSAQMNGEMLRPVTRNHPRGRWSTYRNVTTPAEGFTLRLGLRDPKPFDVHVFDVTSGLPAGGGALMRARGEAAVPLQEGDRTVASRQVRIGRRPELPP